MKKLSLSLILAAITFCANAQTIKEVKSEIVSATVYLSGAELTRKATVSLPAGSTDIIFTNLQPNLNPQTVHVSAEGKLIVKSTQFKQNYMQTNELDAETKKWRDSLNYINRELTYIKDRKDILIMESQLLEQNKTVNSNQTGMNFETVQQFHEFYVRTLSENKRKWREEEEKEMKLNEIKNRLNQQLSDYNNRVSAPDGQIHVKVFADNAVTAKFEVTYVINDAGWSPEYDLRADDVKSPVQLSYKASLWQKTNEDWKNVKLKLSTGSLVVRNTAPAFAPWSLDYYYSGAINSLSVQPMSVTEDQKVTKDITQSSSITLSATGANYTTVNTNQLAVVFDISIPYTIPSDGKPQSVNVQEYELPTQYEYYTLPRVDPDVFLSARIADWEKLNLLAGNANIFFQNAYVGQSYIDPNHTSDTLGISLGRDKKIIVERQKAHDFTKSRVVGTSYKQSVAYDISVKNTRAEEVTVKVIDQFPVSRNSEIEIELEDNGGANVEPETGKLTWILTLKPNDEQKLRYAFNVKYPEKKKVYSPDF